MTSTSTMSPLAQPGAVEWVQQHRTLWTGRRQGRPIGTIERGRRFVFIDPDGVVQGVFRTLAGAQDAAARL
ncbi:MAG: hypothetical protein ABWZ77_06865 [Naasia sp.]